MHWFPWRDPDQVYISMIDNGLCNFIYPVLVSGHHVFSWITLQINTQFSFRWIDFNFVYQQDIQVVCES